MIYNLYRWLRFEKCEQTSKLKWFNFLKLIYRVFGNEGYTESGSILINFLPNLAPNEVFAFTINIRFHL